MNKISIAFFDFTHTKLELYTLSLIFTLLFLSCSAQKAHAGGALFVSVEQKIANWIKPTLSHLTSEGIQVKMQEKFSQLGLMGPDGTWKRDEFKRASTTLLPPLTVKDLNQFIDTIAEKATKNAYLHNALVEIEKQDLTPFYEKVESEKNEVMLDVVVFAKVLDNLTHAARHENGVFESVFNQWEEKRKTINMVKVSGLSCFIKYFSVKKPIEETIHIMKQGWVDPDHVRYFLPINILEATIFDAFKGNFGNAYAGWILAINPPGGTCNPKTGSGPATLSFDGKACQLHLPYARLWNDLYSVWNVGFVADLHNSPCFLAKLLIPSVSGYQENDSEYMFNRTFALYATLNYMLYQYNDEYISGQNNKTIDWTNECVTACFNKVNAESAQSYKMFGYGK